MRVLVLGDTHLRIGAGLPDSVLELADAADHVLHTGDLVSLDVLATLQALAPVTAVHGNVCDHEARGRLPERHELELDGVRIGMLHDAGARGGRHERLRAAFPACGVVVYGHSHEPELAWAIDGALLVINPGSPTQRRRAPTHTVAWLELGHGRVDAAELVHLDG